MSELPTATKPSTTSELTRTLASIEAAKLVADQDVAECLDAVGDLVRIVGDADVTLRWVHRFLEREHLRAYATQHRIALHESRAEAEDQLDRTVVIWTVEGSGMAILPAGQPPATSLLQLREEIAQRAEDEQLAADFQASVAAGYVEDVDTWFARTHPAAK